MTKSPVPAGDQPNYTTLSQELSEVMARLEQGDLDVDDAVNCYDRGLQIINILETHLLKAENTVSQLKAASDTADRKVRRVVDEEE
jgi:exodeoxyribonuclease VII small subunit